MQAAGGSSKQATDFSAFNALLRSERQQQQHSQLEKQQQPHQQGGSQRPPLPRQHVHLTTFDNLTSNKVEASELDPQAQLDGVSHCGAYRLRTKRG